MQLVENNLDQPGYYNHNRLNYEASPNGITVVPDETSMRPLTTHGIIPSFLLFAKSLDVALAHRTRVPDPDRVLGRHVTFGVSYLCGLLDDYRQFIGDAIQIGSDEHVNLVKLSDLIDFYIKETPVAIISGVLLGDIQRPLEQAISSVIDALTDPGLELTLWGKFKAWIGWP